MVQTVCASTLSDFQTKYQNIVVQFQAIESQNSASSQQAIEHFLNSLYQTSDTFFKQLQKDLPVVKKLVKKAVKKNKHDTMASEFGKNIEQLYRFLKKYRLQYDIICFHNKTRSTWNNLFKAVDELKDIAILLPEYGIDSTGLQGLKTLRYQMDTILRKADEYEYRLHADWIDLKLANYVLKIEIIRLRNGAIFHPLYKGMPVKTSYPR